MSGRTSSFPSMRTAPSTAKGTSRSSINAAVHLTDDYAIPQLPTLWSRLVRTSTGTLSRRALRFRAGGTYVVCWTANAGWDATLAARCGTSGEMLSGTSGKIANGNDGICLARGTAAQHAILDCIGDFHEGYSGAGDACGTTSATADHTLVRRSFTYKGNAGDWAASAGTNVGNCEWIVYPADSFDNLGTHTFTETTLLSEVDEIVPPTGRLELYGAAIELILPPSPPAAPPPPPPVVPPSPAPPYAPGAAPTIVKFVFSEVRDMAHAKFDGVQLSGVRLFNAAGSEVSISKAPPPADIALMVKVPISSCLVTAAPSGTTTRWPARALLSSSSRWPPPTK